MKARIMTTARVPSRAPSGRRTSADARRACAAFGLIVTPNSDSEQPPPIAPSDAEIDAVLGSSITLVRGASGSGKSRRLAGLEAALIHRGARVLRVRQIKDGSMACFDAIGSTAEQSCAALAMGGLAEPRIWALPVSCLSVGERSRLELAATMNRARRGDVVIADEFCTPLDRVTAASVCATVQRWAKRLGIHFVAASAHEDLFEMFGADRVLDAASGDIESRDERAAIDPVRYEEGTIADYDALGHLHYLGGRPATWTRVIRAIRRSPVLGEILAGVLVVSMPTLNSSWRRQPWGDRYSHADKRRSASRLNRELRCISRVVVDRRSRGLGIASGLVRAYLADAQTPATEAIAAMGSVCPFFERAGMIGYTVPTPIPNVRLLDALVCLGIQPADLPSENIQENTLLHRELMHWARSSRMLRGNTTPVRTIALMAACRLLSQPRAFAWRTDGEHDVYQENK
ncbi:MAG: hypothetical protein KC996_02775 [Phycisphaerales bacterium]|nr:hypothetical protein [Phycisphaerales bacterium]